ncbi:unnamed protein product [Brachionus calyciflorus]|uniref:Uncharacterized protein n=1 Tax=Brachionus calyciflorus TaxID=104777 RepID=A0A814FIJ9_9BILA|nr:unnamed protein product [Brachionus calyciflorus]
MYDRIDEENDFSIELSCGYSTYYKFLKNQPKKFLCTMCGNHTIDKETCFKESKNRVLIKELEFNKELKHYEALRKSLERIENDPEFYIDKTFEGLVDSLKARRDQLKEKVCNLIDDYFLNVIERVEKEKKIIQEDFEKDLNKVDFIQKENLDSTNLSPYEKANQIEQNIERVKENSAMIKQLVKNISIGEVYVLDEAKKIDQKFIGEFFGKIYITDREDPVEETFEYECKKGLYSHFESINQIQIMKNDYILAASSDQTCTIWDRETEKYLSKFLGHTDVVTSAIFLNNQFFATGSMDKTIKIWNTNTGFCLKTHTDHTGGVLCLKASKSGDIISGSLDGTIKIWSKNVKTLYGHTGGVTCLDETPDDIIISGSSDNSIKTWSPTGKCLFTFNGHKSEVLCVKFISKEIFASCSKDKSIKLWNLENGKYIKSLVGHKDSVQQIEKLEKDKLVSCSYDGTVKIWNMDTAKCLGTIDAHNRPVTCFELTDKGDILTGTVEGSIFIWTKK